MAVPKAEPDFLIESIAFPIAKIKPHEPNIIKWALRYFGNLNSALFHIQVNLFGIMNSLYHNYAVKHVVDAVQK